MINKIPEKHVIFNPLEDEGLSSHARFVDYNKGETVFKQKTQAITLAYVTSGIIKLQVEKIKEKVFIQQFVVKGGMIGLNELACSDIHHFSAIAICECSVALFERDFFMSYVLSKNNLHKELIYWYCKQMNFLINRANDIATKQVHGRLADALFYITELQKTQPDFYSYITRKDLARFVGMSVKSLIRSLNELKHDGIISTDGKKIDITNHELLLRLSKIA